jgi:hypothetical protein
MIKVLSAPLYLQYCMTWLNLVFFRFEVTSRQTRLDLVFIIVSFYACNETSVACQLSAGVGSHNPFKDLR